MQQALQGEPLRVIVRQTPNSRRSFLTQAFRLLVSSAGVAKLAGTPFFAQEREVRSTSREAASALSKIQFRDVAAEAGITPTLVSGNVEKKYILEVYGSGCVWFDYNNDGYVDLYIVNGSTLENLAHPASVKNPPRNYLFRNNGDGTFTDVTRQAGVEGYGWGFGAVAAD